MSDAGERRQEPRGYRVTGRVQGVGFRWWTRRTADELGLRGTVKNRRDGSVEIHAVGLSESLEAFERALALGPSAARVENILRIEPSRDLPERGFRIVF